mmetsp:Transcript_106862/g.344843  ORF Transcript_106862/g.344843 Transcript_106862/m.344843 type:complete len:301 (+) Transcript_106862:448-1350(+)
MRPFPGFSSITLASAGRYQPKDLRSAAMVAPLRGTRTCTELLAKAKNFFAVVFWQLTLTRTNSSRCPVSTTACSLPTSGGRSQSSVTRKPTRSWLRIGRRARSSSCLHCLPHLPSGRMFPSTPGIRTRNSRPRTSIAALSRAGSVASPWGGTRKTSIPSQPSRHCKNSAAVALTAHSTSREAPGRCARNRLRRWLGGTALLKSPPTGGAASRAAGSGRAKCGASSMMSKSRASWMPTSRRGMESDVLPPCCTCRQIPKSSWTRATHPGPRRCCNCVMKLKSSPKSMSSYQMSSPAFRRKT